jgi:hypothetical protein
MQKQLAAAAAGQKVQVQKIGTSIAGNQQQQTVTTVTQQQAGQQCVQVTPATAQLLSPLQQAQGAQQMQLSAPWQIQGMGQFFTANGFQQQLIPNQFIIRGTQPDAANMFIQQPQQAQQTIQAQNR